VVDLTKTVMQINLSHSKAIFVFVIVDEKTLDSYVCIMHYIVMFIKIFPKLDCIW